MNLGKLRCFRRGPSGGQSCGRGWVSIGSAASPSTSRLPPLLPMLRRASPLAQYRRARPAAAMTIRNATTGLNRTNALMTVPTAPVRALLIGGPACVLTDGSYAPFPFA